MRGLRRNMQTVYYANYASYADCVDSDGFHTGERALTYSSPTAIKASVMPANGSVSADRFGIIADYTKTMCVADPACPIAEFARLWVGVETTNPHNYVVAAVSRSLNSTVYALKEVDVRA